MAPSTANPKVKAIGRNIFPSTPSRKRMGYFCIIFHDELPLLLYWSLTCQCVVVSSAGQTLWRGVWGNSRQGLCRVWPGAPGRSQPRPSPPSSHSRWPDRSGQGELVGVVCSYDNLSRCTLGSLHTYNPRFCEKVDPKLNLNKLLTHENQLNTKNLDSFKAKLPTFFHRILIKLDLWREGHNLKAG